MGLEDATLKSIVIDNKRLENNINSRPISHIKMFKKCINKYGTLKKKLSFLVEVGVERLQLVS